METCAAGLKFQLGQRPALFDGAAFAHAAADEQTSGFLRRHVIWPAIKRHGEVGDVGVVRTAEVQTDFVNRQVVFGDDFQRHGPLRRDENIRGRLFDGQRRRQIVDGADFEAIVLAADQPLAVLQYDPVAAGLVDFECRGGGDGKLEAETVVGNLGG